jgi:hypothetical protein
MDRDVFPRPSSVGKGFDQWLRGVLVVRTLYWFDFSESQKDPTITDTDRFNVIRAFQGTMFGPPYKLQQRFLVQAASASARLPRIGILFEPRFEFAANPQEGATADNADCIVSVWMKTKLTSPKAVFPHDKTIVVEKGDAALCLLRYALGLTPTLAMTPSPTFNNTPILATELAELASVAAGILGDTSAGRAVIDLPI